MTGPGEVIYLRFGTGPVEALVFDVSDRRYRLFLPSHGDGRPGPGLVDVDHPDAHTLRWTESLPGGLGSILTTIVVEGKVWRETAETLSADGQVAARVEVTLVRKGWAGLTVTHVPGP